MRRHVRSGESSTVTAAIRGVAAALVLTTAVLAPRGARALPCGANYDLKSHHLQVRLHPKIATMDVTAVVEGHMTVCGSTLAFRLDRRFGVQWVRFQGHPVKFTRHKDEIAVALPRKLAQGTRWGLQFGYHGHMRNAKPCTGCVEYLDGDGLYLRSTTAWYPRGMPFDTAANCLFVVMPREWEAVSAGMLRTRAPGRGGRLWRWIEKWPVRGVGLVAGPYRSRAKRPPFGDGRLRVLRYERPGDDAPELDALDKTMRLFGRLLGKVPEANFTVVEVKGSSTGRSGFDAFDEGTYVTVARPPSKVKGPYLAFLATSLSRCWWGRKVRFANFLGDALAAYTATLALRKFDDHQYFRASARSKVANYRPFTRCAKAPVIIRGLGENTPPHLYNAVVYDKMPIVFLALEQKLGLKPWILALRRFARDFEDRFAGPLDLVDLVERACDEDLGDFVHRYLETPAIPTGFAGDPN